MAKKAWIALIEWIDGKIEDTDETRVYAGTAGKAKSAARAAWSATNGAKWPHCRIKRIEVFPPTRLRGIV